MQVRNAIAVVTVAAFALTLSACTTGETGTNPGGPTGPAAPPTADATPGATPGATTGATADASQPHGKMRPLQDGFDLANVSDTLRNGFPSFANKSDDEIEVILNAACDAMDDKGTPQAGADMIQTYGIAVYDAAFSVTAAIQLYCPEYKAFLRGNG